MIKEQDEYINKLKEIVMLDQRQYSLLHCYYDLQQEINESSLEPVIKAQKLHYLNKAYHQIKSELLELA